MSKILITGGTGLIGRAISQELLKNNNQVAWLSRKEGSFEDIKIHKWDVSNNFICEKAFENVDYLIHLAGSGIADKKWSKVVKKEIIDSRVKSSELLFETIIKNKIKIKKFIGGSAIGYYGAQQNDNVIYENNIQGSDFLSESCVLWEKSYKNFIDAGIETAIIRTGVVLSKNGGAYPKMALPFKYGFGASLASGFQNFPWIHIDDVAKLFIHVLMSDNITGVYNAVASEFISNIEFSALLSQKLNTSFFLPNIPIFLLKLFIGEGACMLTEGLKISNEKIKKTGFNFEFETASQALTNLTKIK